MTIAVQIMGRALSCDRQPFAVLPDQCCKLIRELCELGEGFVHLDDQVGELREVAQVSGVLLHLLPEALDRTEIRRIRGQLVDRQAISMLPIEGLEAATGMIRRVVLDQDDLALDDREHPAEEVPVGHRVELALKRSMVELASKAVEQARDPVGSADAAGPDRWLHPDRRPGVAEAAPLGEARLWCST